MIAVTVACLRGIAAHTTMLLLLVLLALLQAPDAGALENGLGVAGPAIGWSSWNHFGNNGSHCHCRLGAEGLMEIADAMMSSGLADAGWRYVNMDGGWASHRDQQTGHLVPDPCQFPNGIKPVADYIHSKGLLLGIYTDRGSANCKGVQTGSDSHWTTDANDFAAWGVDLVKDDSCGGTTHGTVWQQYAAMRDALNATGRPMWYMITQILDYSDGRDTMHCVRPRPDGGATSRWGVFTVRPWVYAGLDPRLLANSFLAEYCNNKVAFGQTGTQGSGMLAMIDSQALLSYDNLTSPGSYTDMDMLEIGNTDHGHTLTMAESRSQLAVWAILGSPLILGNDPHNMTAALQTLLTNAELLATLSQDRLVSRAKLVFQSPAIIGSWGGAAVRANGCGNCCHSNCSSGQLPPGPLPPPPPNPKFIPPLIKLQAWAKPLADGGAVAAVVFNRDGHTSPPLNLSFAMPGLAPTVKKVTVRDLFHTTTTVSGGPGGSGGVVTVGPLQSHDSAALRITPADGVQLSLKPDDDDALQQQGRRVKDGVAIVSCFGFDPVDATAHLQAALSYNASTVVVDRPASGVPWIVQPLIITSDNVHIHFVDFKGQPSDASKIVVVPLRLKMDDIPGQEAQQQQQRVRAFRALKARLHLMTEAEAAASIASFPHRFPQRAPKRQHKIDHFVVLFMENRATDHSELILPLLF